MKTKIGEKRLNEITEKVGKNLADLAGKDEVNKEDFKKLQESFSEFQKAMRDSSDAEEFVEEKVRATYTRGESQFSEKEMADAYIASKILKRENYFDNPLGAKMKGVISDAQLLEGYRTAVDKELELALKVAPMFPTVDVDVGTFYLPVSDEDTNAIGMYPATGYPLSSADTANAMSTPRQNVIKVLEVIPSGFYGHFEVGRHEQDTTLVPLLPFVREGCIHRLARGIDRALLRGDGTLTAHNASVSNFTAPFKGVVDLAESVAVNGLRVFTGANGAAANTTTIATARTRMGKYGLETDNLVYITTIEGFHLLMQEDIVKTVDTFGPQATILKGQLAAVWGIPIVVSEFMDDKGATSVSNNAIGVLMRKDRFLIGRRREIITETDYDPATRYDKVYMHAKFDFKARTTVAAGALSNTYSLAVAVQTGNGTL